VLVRSDPTTKCAYIHEVEITEKLQSSFKTEALTTGEGALNGDAGAVWKVLQSVFPVNPESVFSGRVQGGLSLTKK